MQHSSLSATHPVFALRGPINLQTLRTQVALLEALDTPNQAMLQNTCEFLNNISKSRWNAMADVFVDIRVGREMRRVSWTKCLYQSIIDAREGVTTLRDLLAVIKDYQVAAHQRITEITAFTDHGHNTLQTLLGEMPRMQECPDVESLKRSISQLTALDLDLLARSETEHGFVLHEIKLSLDAVTVLMNRIETELRKGLNGNPTIIREDHAEIRSRIIRICEMIRDVMKDSWVHIWNENARRYGLPSEACMKVSSPAHQSSSLSHRRQAFKPVKRRTLANPF